MILSSAYSPIPLGKEVCPRRWFFATTPRVPPPPLFLSSRTTALFIDGPARQGRVVAWHAGKERVGKGFEPASWVGPYPCLAASDGRKLFLIVLLRGCVFFFSGRGLPPSPGRLGGVGGVSCLFLLVSFRLFFPCGGRFARLGARWRLPVGRCVVLRAPCRVGLRFCAFLLGVLPRRLRLFGPPGCLLGRLRLFVAALVAGRSLSRLPGLAPAPAARRRPVGSRCPLLLRRRRPLPLLWPRRRGWGCPAALGGVRSLPPLPPLGRLWLWRRFRLAVALPGLGGGSASWSGRVGSCPPGGAGPFRFFFLSLCWGVSRVSFFVRRFCWVLRLSLRRCRAGCRRCRRRRRWGGVVAVGWLRRWRRCRRAPPCPVCFSACLGLRLFRLRPRRGGGCGPGLGRLCCRGCCGGGGVRRLVGGGRPGRAAPGAAGPPLGGLCGRPGRVAGAVARRFPVVPLPGRAGPWGSLVVVGVGLLVVVGAGRRPGRARGRGLPGPAAARVGGVVGGVCGPWSVRLAAPARRRSAAAAWFLAGRAHKRPPLVRVSVSALIARPLLGAGVFGSWGAPPCLGGAEVDTRRPPLSGGQARRSGRGRDRVGLCK